MENNYQILKVSDLQGFQVRDLRSDALEKLKERIEESYNPARPLSVVKKDGKYIVADGNHRLSVLKELMSTDSKYETVPCLVYEDEDIYKIAIKCNTDEDTYAPMDLFDWIDVVKHLLEDEKLTQEEVAKKIGWSRSKVADYYRLIKNVASILKIAKNYQEGRATENVASATFNFTERWFRDSGICDLYDENKAKKGEEQIYQIKLMSNFIDDKFSWSKQKVQQESAKYKLWQQFEEIAQSELMNQTEDLPIITTLINNNTFKSDTQLRQKISDLNKKAQNKLICGDCLIELEQLEDSSIDLVITDPPYGIDYQSNRSQYGEHVTKEGLLNDGLNEATKLIENTCEILTRKTKENAHLYFFIGWQTEHQFRSIIEKYFDIKNVIIWDKGNHGSGDLEGSWGNRYEMIIFASKGRRTLNKPRPEDIILINRLDSTKMIHPTQKPTELIKVLLKASSQKADTVCDPFMGSGSTIKAVNEIGGLNYIGIELNKDMFERAKGFIG
jgi:DNA modification methylase/transcriptional regulator with XRE-family HTH domain